MSRKLLAQAGAVLALTLADLAGQKNGVWWEVDDENGNRGWAPSTQISPRR